MSMLFHPHFNATYIVNRPVSLSLDSAMRSMLSANRRNVFPPSIMFSSKHRLILLQENFEKGLETRYN